MASRDFTPPELINDPTMRKYHLKARTKFFMKNVHEVVKNQARQYDRILVILIPDESDQRTRFLNAWMPDTVEEYHEIVAEVGAPIHAPVRLSVHRGLDEKSEKPYLFVMSKGAEDILVRFPQGIVLDVTVLPASMESESDFAPDALEGNFEVIEEQ